MYRIDFTPKARKDLKSILIYGYQNWGTVQTDQYYDNLLQKLKHLKEYPLMGKECDTIRLGYRKLHVEKHIFFYKIGTDHVVIIRILYDAMDHNEHL